MRKFLLVVAGLVLVAGIGVGAWRWFGGLGGEGVTLIVAALLVAYLQRQSLAMPFARSPLTRWFEVHVKRLFGIGAAGDFGAAMVDRIDWMFAPHADALLRGDLYTASVRRYPPETYPELYTEVPEDIRRSLISDGRLCTGELLGHLAPRRLSVAAVRGLFDENLRRCARLMNVGLLIAAVVAVLLGVSIWHSGAAAVDAGYAESAVYQPTFADAVSRRDVWSMEDARAAAAEAADEARSRMNHRRLLSKALAAGSAIVVLAISFVVIVGVIYLYLVWKALSPRSIRRAVQTIINLDEALLAESKEAIVRWKKRQEKRINEMRAYRKQIDFARRDSSPLIDLGNGTGTLQFRGALSGYLPGQPVRISLADTNSHIAVMGTTGSGKSASVLVPFMHQIVAARPKEQTVSLLVLDGKGVLHHDAQEVAARHGATFRVIGCKEGQVGVDLFDGLEPTIVAAALNDVMNQLGGGAKSDPFWTQMASLILANTAIVARAYDHTEAGRAALGDSGERWYSPAGIYRLALSTRDDGGALVNAAVALSNVEGDPLHPAAPYVTAELFSALTFLRKDCLQFAEQTWGSFIAQITHVLSGFVSMPALRKRFGGGGGDTLPIDSVWDDNVVTAVDLSPLEYGEAARVAAMLFKARVFAQGHARYLANPENGKRHKLVVVMDEAHLLISAGSALSEDSYASVCRAFGVTLVLSFQTLSTLYSAFGEAGGGQRTKTLLDNLRTKLFLSSEGLETASYIRELAGQTLRSTMADFDQYESYVARRFESGDFSMNDDVAPYVLEANELARALVGGEPASIQGAMRPMFRADMRFYRADFTGGKLENGPPVVDWTEKLKAVVWRAEDKRTAWLTQGHEEEPLVHGDEALTFGRGLMLAFVQRAGHIRMDVVNTDAVFERYVKTPAAQQTAAEPASEPDASETSANEPGAPAQHEAATADA
jgi:hypothetical protein